MCYIYFKNGVFKNGVSFMHCASRMVSLLVRLFSDSACLWNGLVNMVIGATLIICLIRTNEYLMNKVKTFNFQMSCQCNLSLGTVSQRLFIPLPPPPPSPPSPTQGLFFFDGRFRPVPLSQTFVGIKATNRLQQMRDMEEVCYEKVLKNVRGGHQVSLKI